MVELKVTSDVRQVKRFLTDLQRRKLPNITARALNRTAQQMQNQVATDMLKEVGTAIGLTRVGFKKAILVSESNHDLPYAAA